MMAHFSVKWVGSELIDMPEMFSGRCYAQARELPHRAAVSLSDCSVMLMAHESRATTVQLLRIKVTGRRDAERTPEHRGVGAGTVIAVL